MRAPSGVAIRVPWAGCFICFVTVASHTRIEERERAPAPAQRTILGAPLTSRPGVDQ